jgi:hypothetical protein
LLAHCRWFSPGTSAFSTTKTGRHDIAEILLFSEMSLFVQVGITLLFQLVGLIGFFSRKKCNFYYEISIIEIDSRKLGTFIVKKIINTN